MFCIYCKSYLANTAIDIKYFGSVQRSVADFIEYDQHMDYILRFSPFYRLSSSKLSAIKKNDFLF